MVNDVIIQGVTRTKREYCAYYTESEPILYYMSSKLDIQNEDIVLEPCAGDGMFIDKLLTLYKHRNFFINAYDINENAINVLNAKYRNVKHISIQYKDTLLDSTDDLFNNNRTFTKIIGNPPYGALLKDNKKKMLKKLYGGYVKETYTLFLRRCIELLETNGKLVFIIPDTFLALHLHKNIRKFILLHTKIEEMILMPSNFFPGVNFGYSNLCIITLRKRPVENNYFNIFSINKLENLYEIANEKYENMGQCERINQTSVLNSIDHSFFVGGKDNTRDFLNSSNTTLGQLADCVTGFYSGDNLKFLKVKNLEIKNSKKYGIISETLVESDFLNIDNIKDGLTNSKIYIPFLKGGNAVISKPTEWFVKWNQETVDFYKNDDKARYQNAKFYFKQGIGVPMIKNSRPMAFLLNNRLFDQSIVGIFPKNNAHLYYLLAFLNSNVSNRLIRIINHTANNSSNYIKKLPIIIDENSIDYTDKIIKDYLINNDVNSTLQNINNLFDEMYKDFL